MPGPIEYPPGTPSWVDLSSPDLDASVRFYGELLGWEAPELGPVEQTGGYRNFLLDGTPVAGLTPLQENTGPPRWSTYVTVADADEAASKVEAGGGSVMLAPFDVLDIGRMAVFADGADGAAFCVWQPLEFRGAQAVNRVGALSWNEVQTREMAAAERFYGDLFGWQSEPIEHDGRVVYGIWKLDGRSIGGMIPMDESFPPEVPANWLAYFGFEDLAAAGATVERLGGRVLVAPRQMPNGSFAVFADPQGAVFGAWQGSYDPPPGG